MRIFHKSSIKIVFLVIIVIGTFNCGTLEKAEFSWPEISNQEKPWTRWWWMGNAVDTASITAQLESFAEAGLGGVEITPIYGVKGYEDKFLDHLSPEWMAMLDHTLKEAERLGLGVDMIMGTGWPFGGPQVELQYAASLLWIEKYPMKANETFDQNIKVSNPRRVRSPELQYVIYFDDEGNKVDITPLLYGDHISFTPSVDADLYAVFCAKTGQVVKRSSPGGAGFTMDHFSKEAFDDYTQPYNEVVPEIRDRLRGIFNDSYEVYRADYTPEMIDRFIELRGYDLLDYIPVLESGPGDEMYSRVLCDYRETLSDLLTDDFARNWDQWCNENTFLSKYQAHGSPGNLIDLYAAADIPECEIFGSPKYDIPGYRRDTSNIRKGDSNKMMLKFCSSAAHLKGDEIVSSETFTWLREHFKTALSHCKPVVDDMFLSGVNHIFLHGSTYSPKDDPWPGWKFYASVNFNPTNNIWKDASFLFNYIARCQSILQNSKTDNEVLLYWPVHDSYASSEPQLLLHQFSIHSIDDWLLPTSFYSIADELDKKGFGFDFISDRFILGSESNRDRIVVSEDAVYKTIIVPDMNSIPLETIKKLIGLKSSGANIIFMGKPETVPGLFEYKDKEQELKKIIEEHDQWFAAEKDLETELNRIGIFGEKASESGLKIIRKSMNGDKIYFIANHSAETIDEYVSFNSLARSVLILDPLSGKTGSAKINTGKNSTEVKICLKPGESVFLKMSRKATEVVAWNYPRQMNGAINLEKSWELEFVSGGPELPGKLKMDTLHSWTDFGPEYENFSGTARYSTSFEMTELPADGYFLELGDIRESARVYLNGKFAGAVFAHPFSIEVSDLINKGTNNLEIEVTNLSANRLRALERSGVEWKKFYEINMVNIHYEPFNAAVWNVEPSGLTGEVKLIPVYYH